MKLPDLTLSLQFARLEDADAQTGLSLAAHRAALPRHLVQRWLRHALAAPGEITVRIVGSEEGRALNRDYRQRDCATNVLTFDYAQAPVVHADLVLCAPVLEQEAAAQGKSLQAHYAHLIVHGALHAQGWEHEGSAAQAEAMEAHEREILARLGFPDPYPNETPPP
ncbi:MAG: rRNA maturation RNase YbeY [Serpentinimonas sp.]|nr:rRNA maturation RNase YbeY [Serpentinimonas sp.]MDO9610280.1 rRNA maturation RNase YbeY [Serpentinimonas sp.]